MGFTRNFYNILLYRLCGQYGYYNSYGDIVPVTRSDGTALYVTTANTIAPGPNRPFTPMCYPSTTSSDDGATFAMLSSNSDPASLDDFNGYYGQSATGDEDTIVVAKQQDSNSLLINGPVCINPASDITLSNYEGMLEFKGKNSTSNVWNINSCAYAQSVQGGPTPGGFDANLYNIIMFREVLPETLVVQPGDSFSIKFKIKLNI